MKSKRHGNTTNGFNTRCPEIIRKVYIGKRYILVLIIRFIAIRRLTRGKNPGDTVKLTVNRNGQEQEISVTLGDDAASQKAAAEQKAQQEQQMPEQGQDFDWGYGDGNDYGYGWGYGDGYGQDGGNGYGYGDGYGNGLNLDDLFGQR